MTQTLNLVNQWGVAQFGRVLGLGPRCRRFESCRPNQQADLVAGVAQLVEQLICNQQVGGSSPSTSSIQFHIFMWECSRVAKGGRL